MQPVTNVNINLHTEIPKETPKDSSTETVNNVAKLILDTTQHIQDTNPIIKNETEEYKSPEGTPRETPALFDGQPLPTQSNQIQQTEANPNQQTGTSGEQITTDQPDPNLDLPTTPPKPKIITKEFSFWFSTIALSSIAGLGFAAAATAPYIASVGVFTALPIGMAITSFITGNLLSEGWKNAVNLTVFTGLSTAVVVAGIALGVFGTTGAIVVGTALGLIGVVLAAKLAKSIYDSCVCGCCNGPSVDSQAEPISIPA